MARFEDKVVAITGGGSDIGKETATRFVAEGARVAINGRDLSKLKAAGIEISSVRRPAAQSGGSA